MWKCSQFVLALFPGPAQLSVCVSMEKQEKAWYLFSCEHNIVGNGENLQNRLCFTYTHILNAWCVRQSVTDS